MRQLCCALLAVLFGLLFWCGGGEQACAKGAGQGTVAESLTLPLPQGLVAQGEGGKPESQKQESFAPEKLAAEGNAEAQYRMGAHEYNVSIGRYDRAIVWLEKAVQQEHFYANVLLTIITFQQKKLTEAANGAKAIVAQLAKKAEAGEADAQYYYGYFLRDGIGVTQNEPEAVQWWQRAAEQGDARAQFHLGVCYAEGRGVAKDEREAVKLYHLAAAQGQVIAQYTLALCYMNGRGVVKDEAEGVKWYRVAAEQGLAEAQSNLGLCYMDGRGTTKDGEEAVKWFRLAAAQGLIEGQHNLGWCYENGIGVEKDEREAQHWYEKSQIQRFIK